MKKVNCILLIDDNEADNEFHKRAITKAGICEHIAVATSGEKALDYLKGCETGVNVKPDILFLDINMPGMNGFEFLEEYKKLGQSAQSKIVVFMLTSSLFSSDKDKAMETGNVSDFLNKPLTSETVGNIVEKYF